jgi:hypothetical protein
MAVTSAQTAGPPPNIKYAEIRRSYNLRNRRFGRHDLKECYEISDDFSVGSSEIGGVSVDCRFIFSKTRLGVLQDKDHPGGIIYMNLTIKQPPDWRLREANISVLLKDKDAAFSSHRSPSKASVAIFRECYGPKTLTGPKLTAETTQHDEINPSVEALGFGVTVGSTGRVTSQPRTAWWNFDGRAETVQNSSPNYTKLHWTMSPNTLAYTSDAPSKIQTAFAFSHNYRPFLLQIEIDGKIRHLHRKLKDRAIGVFRKEPIKCLLFEFDPDKKYEAQIFEQAMGLKEEMEEAARKEKAVKIDPLGSSDDLFAQQNVDTTGLPPPPDQSKVIVQLQSVHMAVMNYTNTGTLPDVSNAPTPNFQVKKGTGGTETVDGASREEITQALQQVPNLPWWIRIILLSILRVWSVSPSKQQGIGPA